MTVLELQPPATPAASPAPKLVDWEVDEEPLPRDQWMTTEEFLELPEEDAVDRELIRGRLWEEPMTYRNRPHSRAGTQFSTELENWNRQQPEPRGEVLVGDSGFTVLRDPDTTVGIDVAYISPTLAADAPRDARVIEGVPVLAVEILSPSDTQKKIFLKVSDYLAAGVKLVWLAEPIHRTIGVYRPGAEPVFYNATQQIDAEPHLPGFRANVADLFG